MKLFHIKGFPRLDAPEERQQVSLLGDLQRANYGAIWIKLVTVVTA